MAKLIWGLIILILIAVGVVLIKDKNLDDDAMVDDSGDTAGEVMSIKDSEGVSMAVLEAVDGSDSSGGAYVVRSDGKLIHLVEATMPDPAEGSVYEGWLVDNSVTPLAFFSTGVMTKSDSGTWVLEFEADEEFPGHNLVVITEETVVDATPEAHIIEGSFE